ncbi:MAG: methyltransferase domain-containing protein [Nostoc sp.]|uniref:SAM-dependent methyltransferase n=1 Tax=Nostoc sp. TaxID=1180 RepID=UPI002FFC6D1C
MTFLRDKAHLQALSNLYDQTWAGARLSWLNQDNLAQHLGYWDENTRTHAESLINMNRAIASRINLQPNEYIFDAGCGFGGTSLWLAQEYNVHVVGCSISADQVARSRQYASKRGLEKLVRFEQKDYLSTDLADASFDVVWAQESVCHTPNQHAFLTEAYRLLKSGGRLVIEDCYLFNRPYTQDEMHLLQSWFHDMLIPSLPRGEQVIAWAENTGFENVKLEDISHYVKPSYRRIGKTLSLMNPIVFTLHSLGLQSDILSKFGRGMLEQQKTFEQSLWFVGIFSAYKP